QLAAGGISRLVEQLLGVAAGGEVGARSKRYVAVGRTQHDGAGFRLQCGAERDRLCIDHEVAAEPDLADIVDGRELGGALGRDGPRRRQGE
ncbi:hypothetical protein D1F98_11825, partial [Staphylococcus aureus]